MRTIEVFADVTCPFTHVGLRRMVAADPPSAAFEMLATGEFIDAARALHLGLINRLAAPDALADTTMAMAATVAISA